MIECCSELAQVPPAGDYQPRAWAIDPTTINQWGAQPPLRFLRAGFPVAPPVRGPAWVMTPGRTPEAATA